MKNGEINRNGKEVLEERQDGEDYAFAIPKRVAASSIVTFRSHEHHGCGLAKKEALFAHQLTRVSQGQLQERTVLPTPCECTSS
jgi:hypothetical protein